VRFRTTLTAAIALLLWTTPAAADPISVLFDVQVFERLTGLLSPFEPYDQRFSLRLTYDPALGSGTDYGPASFSPGIFEVPLPLPSVPPGLSLSSSSFTSHSVTHGDGTRYNATAAASVGGSIIGQSKYNAFLILENSRPETNPVITPETFPAHLGLPLGPFGQFNFQYGACAVYGNPHPEVGCFGSSFQLAFYHGRATLTTVESPAVPEPATLALVGGGLAILASRRRRTMGTCEKAGDQDDGGSEQQA
jgi:PEP-CTERM putative exosortase interaction domain